MPPSEPKATDDVEKTDSRLIDEFQKTPADKTAYKAKYLTFSYLVALFLIFLLFIVMYVLIQTTIKNQSADARVINIAGRQRMLAQRIGKETLLLWQSKTVEMSEIHHKSLGETMAKWSRTQTALVNGDEESNTSHKNSVEIIQLFDEAKPHFQKLKTAVNKIMAQEPADFSSNPLSTVLIRDIVEANPLYLKLMEKIVSVYEKEGIARIDRLKKYENILMFMLLALMVLEVRYIFQPTVNRIQNSYRAFQQVSENLMQEMAERQRTVQLMSRFGRILDNSLNEIYIFNAETMYFTQVNQGALKNLGYTMDEMKKLTAMNIKPEVTEEKFYQIIAPLKTGEKEYILFNTKHQRKDGTLYPVEVRLQLSASEMPPVYVAIIQDVTERQRAEESIRQKSKQLKRANKELEEFNYVASHDLQEPLRTLTSYCTFLKKDIGENLSDRAQQDIDFITDAAKRMQNLIQDLLELSRAGRWTPKMEAVDMNQCVKTVSKDLDASIRESNATVKWDRLPMVTGDSSHLGRVIQNLVGNALKFHKKEPPVVNISAQRQNGMWAITVADNGIGMESQYLDQIFTPFKRLHGKGTFEGSGIGLSVCKKIIDRHGGNIQAESEPGKGSRFKFTLKAWDNKSDMEADT